MELYRRQIEELESHLSAAALDAGVSSQCECLTCVVRVTAHISYL